MNAIQEKKLKMYSSIIELLDGNTEIVSKIPYMNRYLTSLTEARDTIMSDRMLQGPVSMAKKEEARRALEQTCFNVSKRLTVYANDKQDKVLVDAVKFTKTDFSKMTEMTLLNEASVLYDKTQKHLTELTLYGLTAETQTGFAGDIALFKQSIPEMRKARQDGKDVTIKLDEDFERADDVVDNLDLRMEMVQMEYPVFYRDYKEMRKISLQRRRLALVGSVMDAETGEGVMNARVLFVLAGESDIEKYSSDYGDFRVKNMKAGIYTVVVTKIGYADRTLSAVVSGDDTYHLIVKLTKSN